MGVSGLTKTKIFLFADDAKIFSYIDREREFLICCSLFVGEFERCYSYNMHVTLSHCY